MGPWSCVPTTPWPGRQLVFTQCWLGEQETGSSPCLITVGMTEHDEVS